MQEALKLAEDELERALGPGVRVRSNPRAALRAEIEFDDLDELLEFARAPPGAAARARRRAARSASPSPSRL